MIEIERLTYVYPGSNGRPARKALDALSLSVPSGTFCILSGPNGSGKSTLFRILCGLALPGSGRVLLEGHDLAAAPDTARAALGVVFQSPALDKHLSIAENLALHARLYRLDRKTFLTRRTEALRWTGLEDRLNERVDALSGGLARQVELAKVLLTRPKVLLLDEPTVGLDPSSRRGFLSVLHALHRDHGMTVLMTTHVFDEAEDADQVAVMKDGRVLAVDTPKALKQMLGSEMLVVCSNTPEALALRLRRDMGLTPIRHDGELRIEDLRPQDSLPLLERILERYREQITSIAIKQPGLEDVFIHLTNLPDDSAPDGDGEADAPKKTPCASPLAAEGGR